MLEMIFLTCAVVGGGVMIFQMGLTLLGIGGGEEHGFDAGHFDAEHLDAGVDHPDTSLSHAVDGQLHGHDSSHLFSVVSLLRFLLLATILCHPSYTFLLN